MQTSPDCAGGIPQAWIQRLFSRMAASYGNKVSAMWGDCPQADIIDAWRTGLQGFSGDQIGAGLQRMLDAYPEWPPTLGQFRALCKAPSVPQAHRLFLVDKSPRQPIDPAVKEKIDSLVAKMKVKSENEGA